MKRTHYRGVTAREQITDARVWSSLPGASCDPRTGMGSVKSLEMCSTDTCRKPSGATAPPSILPNASPAFWRSLSSGWHLADLHVLVSGGIVLELVGFEEIFQLLHVAQCSLSTSSWEGCSVFCTSMGFPTARLRGEWWLRAGTTESAGTLVFPLQWSSE